MARNLQNRLALAQFKTKHGWEDLTLDNIEPKYEEERRRKRLSEGDVLSDSSSSASDLPSSSYPNLRGLMSSPLKAPLFSDAVLSSNGSTGHRKRTYLTSFDKANMLSSSPSKRYRSSPAVHRSASFAAGGGSASWRDGGRHHHHHQFTQSSPIKPRRQQHFTTSTGPDVSFFISGGGSASARRLAEPLTSPNFAAPPSDDEDDMPMHSFGGPGEANIRSSPPSTPPMRNRALNGRGRNGNREKTPTAQTGPAGGANGKAAGGEEGADLLLYLAASPSPAVPSARSSRMDPPSTPPQRNSHLALPSSMMTTPGGSNLFGAANTPSQAFDFSDFVNITPSPEQKPWKTPGGFGSAKTPRTIMARRRLTFDEPLA